MYRDLEKYYFESTLCGGPPLNPDYRLASVKENIYVLTWNNKNYAVPKERAERFAEKVISGSTGKHRGFFPLVRELNGKKTAAVVEINSGTGQVYYDFRAPEKYCFQGCAEGEGGSDPFEMSCVRSLSDREQVLSGMRRKAAMKKE